MTEQIEKAYRKGFIAACEWILDGKPSATEIRSKVKFYKEMLK